MTAYRAMLHFYSQFDAAGGHLLVGGDTNPARVANRARLRDHMIDALKTFDRDPLLAKLEAAGVPASPINTIGQMIGTRLHSAISAKFFHGCGRRNRA